MTEGPLDLVSALVRLAKRYPKQDWQTLVEWLEDGRLTSLLNELSEVSENTSKRKPSAKKQLIPDAHHLITEVERVDSQKGALLQRLHQVVQDTGFFDNVASIRRFADMVDVEIPRSYSRGRAIDKFISQAALLTSGRIEDILEKQAGMPGDSVADFRRLSNIIRRRQD